MPDISDNTNWFEVDASNDRPPPAGWPEGQMPSTVNDCARAMMGAIKRFWDRINPTAPSITVTGNLWQYNTTDPAHPTAYVEGEIYSLLVAGPAVGGDQLQINSLSALPIYKITSTGPVATVANDWLTGAMPRFAYRSDLNAGAGGWLLLDTPPLPISSDASGNLTFPGNCIFSANVGVTGSLAVTGGAVFTSTMAVSGHVGLSGGLGVAGGATVDTLTVSGATSLSAVNIGANLNVAGDEWARSYNLNSGAAYIDSAGDISGNGSLNIGGSGTFASGNVVMGGNGIAYFGSGHQVGFTWDGTIEAYVDRSSVGSLVIQNGSPTFGNVTMTGSLQVNGNFNCSNQVSANTVVANGITSNGGLNVAGGISAGGQVSANTIVANGITSNGNIAVAGSLSSAATTVGNMTLGANGISYSGGDQFAFTWSGYVNVLVDGGAQGVMLRGVAGDTGVVASTVQLNQLSGGPTNWSADFFDTNNTGYRCFCDSVSDARFKKNIHATKVDALAAILATPVRAFEWKKEHQKLMGDQPVAIGLVAQEVKDLLPGVVVVGSPFEGEPDDVHAVNLKAAVPFLIRAIQQLTARVAELEGGHA